MLATATLGLHEVRHQLTAVQSDRPYCKQKVTHEPPRFLSSVLSPLGNLSEPPTHTKEFEARSSHDGSFSFSGALVGSELVRNAQGLESMGPDLELLEMLSLLILEANMLSCCPN